MSRFLIYGEEDISIYSCIAFNELIFPINFHHILWNRYVLRLVFQTHYRRPINHRNFFIFIFSNARKDNFKWKTISFQVRLSLQKFIEDRNWNLSSFLSKNDSAGRCFHFFLNDNSRTFFSTHLLLLKIVKICLTKGQILPTFEIKH